MKLPKKIAISLFRKKSKKPAKYWFDKMTDIEKKRFSDNFENLRTDITLLTFLWKKEYRNFEDFLFPAFEFHKSNEGIWYWMEVLNNYRNEK